MLPQKVHLKKLALSKNTFKFSTKIVHSINTFQNVFKKICSLKKYITKKNFFFNFSLKKNFEKHFFKVTPSKNTFSKLVPQKIHLKRNFLRNCFLKIAPWKLNLQGLKIKNVCLLSENFLKIGKKEKVLYTCSYKEAKFSKLKCFFIIIITQFFSFYNYFFLYSISPFFRRFL